MNRNKVANISVKGYSHEMIDKECQDSSISWQDKKYSAVIVCDGHGGEKYFRSAAGSCFACVAGKKMISGFMDFVLSREKVTKSWDTLLSQLETAIVNEWNNLVADDYAEHPFEGDSRFETLPDDVKRSLAVSPIKAYGSTFIAAVLTDKFMLVLKLGDGNVCTLNAQNRVCVFDRSRQELVDDQLQFNLTTSLCNSDAAKSFKHCVVPVKSNQIRGVLLSSDGVINSFATEEAYAAFAESVFGGFWEQKLGDAKQELADFLPELSKKGSGDDLSIAIILEKQK